MGAVAVIERPTAQRLLAGLFDGSGRDSGYAALTAPVRTAADDRAVARVRATHRLVGFTSFLTFPRWVDPAFPYDYGGWCEAWCHCVRRPADVLPACVPHALLAQSDFVDPSLVNPRVLPATRRCFDFVYVCEEGTASEYVKGWALARRCLPVLCGTMRLRGLLVGRPMIPDLEPYDTLTVCGRLPWRRLLAAMAAARFVLVASGPDPSPRVIAEALALDTPVLVNRHILGGWHYVTPFTGTFFEGETDVGAGARRCLDRSTGPRRWFGAHHGPRHAGARLAKLVRSVDDRPGRSQVLHLGPPPSDR